jgi:hypothetical protein
MTAGASPLERGCRRLLALYPAGHRRLHEEEMVGVLLASTPEGQRRLALADKADLVVVARHGPGFWPLIAGGPAVLVLALRGLRRTAGLAALLVAIVAATMVNGFPGPAWWLASLDPGAVLTCCTSALAAAALLLSAGPARGLRLLRRPVATLTGAGVLTLVLLGLGLCVEMPYRGTWYSFYDLVGVSYMSSRPGLHAELAAGGAGLALLAVIACWCLRSVTGRRVLLLLSAPMVAYIMAALWRVPQLLPAWFGILGRFLPLLNAGWLALILGAVLLAVLAPLPAGRIFQHARWRAEQSR